MSLINNKQEIKNMIKKKFNIKDDQSRIKLNISDVNNFLNNNNLNINDIKCFIKNEKKDTYTIQLQENLNMINTDLLKSATNNKQINNMIKNLSENVENNNAPEIHSYNNAIIYYIKRFIHDYLINYKNNIYLINKINISLLNTLLSKYLNENYFEYKKNTSSFNVENFKQHINTNYHYDIINNKIDLIEFKQLKLTFTDDEKKIYMKRLKFIRDIKSYINTRNIDKITKHQHLYEFKTISNECLKNRFSNLT